MYLAYLRSGDELDAAIVDIRACVAQAESLGFAWDGLNGRFWCAKLLVSKGDPKAREELEEVIERAARMKSHLLEKTARKILADLG
jgi:hypothetical protein